MTEFHIFPPRFLIFWISSVTKLRRSYTEMYYFWNFYFTFLSLTLIFVKLINSQRAWFLSWECDYHSFNFIY
uniref:Uncharacterized protein n=1 Tax=Panstrongylus lignarius TaxID=156445 RepID=A0A224XU40_9HEMI